MAGFGELPAYPDALPALHAADRGRACRVACLTNGVGRSHLVVRRAGRARAAVDRVISVGEVYRWKPAGVVYLYAAEVMGVAPEPHGAGRGARLGLPRRQAGRADHRLGEPEVRRASARRSPRPTWRART